MRKYSQGNDIGLSIQPCYYNKRYTYYDQQPSDRAQQSMPVDPAVIELIKEQLLSLNDVKLLYLFGSRVTDAVHSESDWDIAILPKQKLNPIKRWELSQTLASQLKADVDLIDLTQASTVMRMQVISNGDLLFGEQYDADVFETQVYSMYSRLQESRQEIMQNFIKDLKDE